MEDQMEEGNNINDQGAVDNLALNDSQIRRQYPKNYQGGKEEWTGLHLHQHELNQELGSLEKQIKDLKKGDLSANYNAKIIEQLEQRQNYLENKKIEGEVMQMKGKEYQEEIRKMKLDRDEFRNFMKKAYDYTVTEKQQNKKIQLEEKLNYENALLDYNRQKLESEKRRKIENKFIQKKDIEQQLELANEKNKMKQMERINNQKEILYLNQQKAMQEIMKEESYKKFYNQWNQNEEKLKEIHNNNVTSHIQAKEKQMEAIINKQVDEYKTKLFQEEMNRIQKKNNDKSMTVNTIKDQLKYKGDQKELDNMEKQIKQEQRLNDLKSYNEILQQQKIEKIEKQNQYRDLLQKQAEETKKKNINLNQNRMTNAEKRINFLDLQAYKEVNPQSFSSLIGYSPQIGGYSTRVKAVPVIPGLTTGNAIPPNLLNQTISKVQSLSPGIKGKRDLDNENKKITAPQTVAYPQTTKNATSFNNIFGDPVQDKGNVMRKTPTYNQTNGASSLLHNPLTNPIPSNNQNPYIVKEWAKAQQNKNIFSNVADRNLINKV